MKKLTLTEWAAVGEIVATVAVVISLLFVAYSINRNTDAEQASGENILFERHTDLANQFLIDASLAELMVKQRSDKAELTEAEAIRWEKYELNMLDIWALAHSRNRRGFLSERQWLTWDTYFTHMFKYEAEAISKARWVELQYAFDQEFWRHVGAVLFEKDAGGE